MDLGDLARTASDFGDARLIAYLDGLDVPDLIALLMPPAVQTSIALPPRPVWAPGDPRPSLADERPEVMAAVARCAMARWRQSARFGDLAETVSHPAVCGWCDYPAEELQRALEWAMHYSRFITDEAYVWRRGHSAYRRQTGRSGRFENVTWADFAALPRADQRRAVDAAVAQSRANLEPDPVPVPKEHVPWCDLPADHPGECPDIPA